MGEFTEVINYLRELNIAAIVTRLVLTVLLSGAVGIDRERHGKAAGLRTHIFVCLGAAMAAMTGLYLSAKYTVDISRISAQVVSGIGFLGAGTILVRNKSTVAGLTTAASVWATGPLGLAIGYGFYEAAVLCTLFMLLIAGPLGNIDRMISHRIRDISIYAEFADASKLNGTLELIGEKGLSVVKVDLVPAKSNLPDGIGADIVIRLTAGSGVKEAIGIINETENIHFAIEA